MPRARFKARPAPKRTSPAEHEGGEFLRHTGNFQTLAGAVALLAVPAFVLRVLVVASFDVQLAAVIVANASPVQLVYSSLITALPGVLSIGAIYGAYFVSRQVTLGKLKRWKSFVIVQLLFVLTLPSILMTPYDGPLLPLITLAALNGVASIAEPVRYGDRVVHLPKPALIQAICAVIIAALSMFYFALVPSMWLPPERAEINGKPQVIYVLSETDGNAVIFDASKR